MTKDNHKSPNEGNEEERNVGDGFTPLDQLVSPVGPQMTIPFTSGGSTGQKPEDQENLHLFGQSQFHNNLGPVYALPTFPKEHGGEKGTGQPQGNSENFSVFGQSQLHDNLGPVYALPTYPWPHGNNQGMISNQLNSGHHQNMVNSPWQQWGTQPHTPYTHPMAFKPYCCGHYFPGYYYR